MAAPTPFVPAPIAGSIAGTFAAGNDPRLSNAFFPGAYGVVANGRTLSDVTTSTSSAAITSASYTFVLTDAGKSITVAGAGASGAVLNTTISSVSGGAATLATAPSTAISGTAVATFGTDDTAAYNACIAAAGSAAAANGATILMPIGMSIVSGSLIWKSRVSMTGYGAGVSILKWISTSDQTVGVISGLSGSTANPYVGCRFSDFEVDCLASTQANYNVAGKAIYMQYLSRCYFQRLYLHDSPATALGVDFLFDCEISGCVVANGGRLAGSGSLGGACIGIGIAGASAATMSCRVISNVVHGGYSFGIFFEAQDNTNSDCSVACVANTVFLGTLTRAGIGDCGLQRFICTDNKVIGSTLTPGNGINVSVGTLPTQSLPGINGTIARNTISGVSGSGIVLDYTTQGSSACGYRVIENLVQGVQLHGIRIYGNVSAILTMLEISRNKVTSSVYCGLYVSGSAGIKDLILDDNVFANNGTNGSGITQSGIAIACAVAGFRCRKNACFDDASGAQKYGFYVSGAITGAVILDNDFNGNATAGINITGSISGGVLVYDAALGFTIGNSTSAVTIAGATALPTATVTAAFTYGVAQRNVTANAASGAITGTLPAWSTAIKGRTYAIKKLDSSSNAVSITCSGSDLIDGSASISTTTQYAVMTVTASDTSGRWDRGF